MIGYDSGFERIIPRISRLNKTRRGKNISKVLAAAIRLIWPCDIDCNASIGKISVPHAVGIVVGCNAIIEDDVSIMSGVVIGSTHPGRQEHAHIKRGAVLGANSVILGSITIGEGAIIGAGAVITRDVPAHAVVVGHNRVINTVRTENES